jgi:hypothetical protein
MSPTTSKDSPQQELRSAIRDSNEILIKATTVFPFTLFPDTITVDRAKITVKRQLFFRTGEVVSIRIEDVLNVSATLGPIFGSIKIRSRVFSNEKPYVVDRFWRNDVLQLKRIIQGYIIALQREIDCESLPTSYLARLLFELGKDEHPQQ